VSSHSTPRVVTTAGLPMGMMANGVAHREGNRARAVHDEHPIGVTDVGGDLGRLPSRRRENHEIRQLMVESTTGREVHSEALCGAIHGGSQRELEICLVLVLRRPLDHDIVGDAGQTGSRGRVEIADDDVRFSPRGEDRVETTVCTDALYCGDRRW
jgi:hypothetical protein